MTDSKLPCRSPKLAAFGIQIGPLDRFDRQAGRSSPFAKLRVTTTLII